jgi:hypothetical protein
VPGKPWRVGAQGAYCRCGSCRAGPGPREGLSPRTVGCRSGVVDTTMRAAEKSCLASKREKLAVDQPIKKLTRKVICGPISPWGVAMRVKPQYAALTLVGVKLVKLVKLIPI